MNRSGYTDDSGWGAEEQWALIRWRGAVKSSIRGARGQSFLIELRDALDSMEDKRLVSEDLESDGQHCALGVVLHKRGIDPAPIQAHLGDFDVEWGYEGGDEDSYWDSLSFSLNIAGALAREIMFINDESYSWRDFGPVVGAGLMEGPMNSPDKRRWLAVRNWVAGQIQLDDGKGRQHRNSERSEVDPGAGTDRGGEEG